MMREDCYEKASSSLLVSLRRSLKSHRKLGIGSFEALYFLLTQFEVNSRDSVRQMLWFGRTNNRCSHDLLREQPCQSDLRHWNMTFFGNGFHGFDNLTVSFLSPRVEGFCKFVRFTAFSVRIPLAGEQAACQWTPRDHPDTLVEAEWQHFSFFFAHEQVVLVLHRDIACPTMEIGHILRLNKLPGIHAAGTDVAHFAALHQVM